MSFKIAVSGKGGTGKTTICALIINYLLQNELTPILAIDADANSNLAESLGVKYENTIGKILDDFLKKKDSLPLGMSKEALLEYKIYEILVEEKGFDLLVMGHGEGPGCYCYPNNVIRDYIDKLASNYKYVVIDNQAGMEHISRRTNGDLDILLLISDATIKGINTCGKLQNLSKKLDIKIKKFYLVVNKVKNSLPLELLKMVKNQDLELLEVIPEDEEIKHFDMRGIPLINLKKDSLILEKINNLMKKLLFKEL
jgi:CO dehydrogenase maturation factor